MDVSNNFVKFFERGTIDQSKCFKLALLLEDHVKANSIFEVKTDRKIEPVVIPPKKDLKLPAHVVAMSLAKMQFLSTLVEFLMNSRGINIH